jgi:hypothetical protein
MDTSVLAGWRTVATRPSFVAERLVSVALIVLTLLPFTAPLPIYHLGHRHGSTTDVQSDDSCLDALPQTNLSPRSRFMTITAAARHTIRALAAPRSAVRPERPPLLQASFYSLNVLRI